MERTIEMTTHKTLRFWHYSASGEPVLIKIKAGQSFHHWSGGATDEGWSSETNVWTFDGKTLLREWQSDGRDCDGRLTRYGESICPAALVHSGYCDETGICFPAWECRDQGQRDEYAEMAGY
jgi:hypothetical protein